MDGGAFALWHNLLRYVTPVAVAIVFVYNLIG
jgi:NSS family neurotransmitter:Na+ symporter